MYENPGRGQGHRLPPAANANAYIVKNLQIILTRRLKKMFHTQKPAVKSEKVVVTSSKTCKL